MLDVTDATFQTEVVERSSQVPVVVDLWAEWCGPCRTLGPILEKAIAATNGRVAGVKVDVDANPQISQAFQVQSIPAVYALVDGKPVDGFMGAQPEHLVEEFVQRLVPTEDDRRLAALVEAGDEASLRTVLAEQPDREDAILALAQLLIDDDRSDEALDLLARIPESPQTRHLAALARAGGPVDDLDDKLEALIGRVKGDDEARQEFVDLLEVLGPDDPRTGEWRRRLTSALY